MSPSRAVSEFIKKNRPDLILNVDWHIVAGDSIAAGAGGVTDQTAPDGVAWACYGSDIHHIVETLSDTGPNIGGKAAWVKMAETIYNETGRRSLWTAMAKGNTSLVKEAHPDYWDTSDVANSMWEKDHEGLDRSSILRGSKAIMDASPKFRIRNTYLHFAEGSKEASALASGLIDQTRYVQAHNDLLTWAKANWGVDKMFIWTSGRVGADAAEVAANNVDQDLVAVRTAQLAAAAQNGDIHVVFDHAHEHGDPFNTLTTNPDGSWSSGFENHTDHAHYSEASYNCIGVTAGKAIAGIIGV